MLSLYFKSPSMNKCRPCVDAQPFIGPHKSNILLYCFDNLSKCSLFESCWYTCWYTSSSSRPQACEKKWKAIEALNVRAIHGRKGAWIWWWWYIVLTTIYKLFLCDGDNFYDKLECANNRMKETKMTMVMICRFKLEITYVGSAFAFHSCDASYTFSVIK